MFLGGGGGRVGDWASEKLSGRVHFGALTIWASDLQAALAQIIFSLAQSPSSTNTENI